MKILLSILLFICFLNMQAQQEKILAIRQQYAQLKQQIRQIGTDSATPGFYADILIKNASNAPWRAIGIYADTIKLYYTDLMEAELESGDSTNALKMVCQTALYSGTKIYREWMFESGLLVFYFEKQTIDNVNEEYRFYFSNQKLIRYMQGGQIIGYGDDTAPIFKAAESLKSWFFNSFIRNL